MQNQLLQGMWSQPEAGEEAQVDDQPTLARAAMPSWSEVPTTHAPKVELLLHARCFNVLATRGASTDSFLRVVLQEDTKATDTAVLGKTEVVQDSLSPAYKHAVRIRYTPADVPSADSEFGTRLWLRFDICDPGQGATEASRKLSSTSEDKIPVIGSVKVLLRDMHEQVKAGVMLADYDLGQHSAVKGTISTKSLSSHGSNLEALGVLRIIPELVCDDKSFIWLILGGKKLKTNRISLPPDPYVKISRVLPDKTVYPVYQTAHVRSTRDCAWKTAPIPMQRFCNGDRNAKLVVEVWDWEDLSSDRLIGRLLLPAPAFLDVASTAEHRRTDPANAPQALAPHWDLKPPRYMDADAGRKGSFLGFGISSIPGSCTTALA